MPQLPQYNAPLGGLPEAGGRQATIADVGDTLGGVADAAQKFYTETEAREARDALVGSTAIRAKYSQRLNDAVLNGEDVDKIRQQMNDELQKVGSNFITPRGNTALELHTLNDNMVFNDQANAIKVERAGLEAKTAADSFIKNSSSILTMDPTQLPGLLSQAGEFAQTLHGVKPADRYRITKALESELNMTTAMAYARMAPGTAKQKLEGGEWDLTPEQRQIAIGRADETIRAKRADEEYAYTLEKRKLHDGNEKAYDGHFKDIVNGVNGVADRVLNDPALTPETREHLIDTIDQRNRQLNAQHAPHSDEQVKAGLWLDITAPPTSPRRIYVGEKIRAAVATGQLTVTDAEPLMTLVAKQTDPNNIAISSRIEGMTSALEKAINTNPKYQLRPALALAINLDYQGRVFEAAEALRKDNKDPSMIFDRNSPYFVGSESFIQQSIDAAEGKKRSGAIVEPNDVRPQKRVLKDGSVWVWSKQEPYDDPTRWYLEKGIPPGPGGPAPTTPGLRPGEVSGKIKGADVIPDPTKKPPLSALVPKPGKK